MVFVPRQGRLYAWRVEGLIVLRVQECCGRIRRYFLASRFHHLSYCTLDVSRHERFRTFHDRYALSLSL